MKVKSLVYILNLLFMTSCVQGADNALDIRNKHAVKQPIDWVPYLTANGKYIYVDKNKRQKLDGSEFVNAVPFLATGYAIVEDVERRNALIDATGEFIVGYTEDVIELAELGELTLVKIVREYDKRMPIWKWEWNILGGDIQKNQTYHRVEIRVLETGQVLFLKEVPYREDDFDLDYVAMGANHYLLNSVLFEVKKKKFKQVKKNILYSLDKGRYIPDGNNLVDIYQVGIKKPILSHLEGVTQLELKINNKPVVLDSINQDRYRPTIGKLLLDNNNKDIYVYPQYDKVFPKVIRQASEEQCAFLKQVSLVYSVNDSPYFILGRFNYDHDVWSYDWLYVDVHGNLVADIRVKDFFIRDQIGYLVWPDQTILFSNNTMDEGIKTGKIRYIYQSDNLFVVKAKLENGTEKEGVWNGNTQRWEIEPLFNSIKTMHSEQQIFALRREAEGTYQLFDNKKKVAIGANTYQNVYSNGMAEFVLDNNQTIYFYIDIFTGDEYRA